MSFIRHDHIITRFRCVGKRLVLILVVLNPKFRILLCQESLEPLDGRTRHVRIDIEGPVGPIVLEMVEVAGENDRQV